MSQLVMQLRIDALGQNVPTIVREDCSKAAARIEQLEATLREIVQVQAMDPNDNSPPATWQETKMLLIAERALAASETKGEQG